MALTTPTVAELNEEILAQLEASIGEVLPLFPKAANRVIAKVLAGTFILLYKYGGFLFLQLFVSTATLDEVTILGKVVRPLEEWGLLIGVGSPVAATQARLQILITQKTGAGTSTLTAGTQVVRDENGVTYLLETSVLVDAPTVTGIVQAASDQSGGNGEGVIGNLAVNDLLNFANPLAGVERSVKVLAVIETAANAEDVEVYRQRVLDRFQKRLQGGALVDYEAWGEEAAGILNVYPYTGANPGEVDVYVEATVLSSPPDGIPSGAQITAVEEAIQLDLAGKASRRPANAAVNVSAIVRTKFDVQVTALVVPNPAATQVTLTTAITEYLLSRAPFIPGLTLPPKTDTITTNELIALVAPIVLAVEGTFGTVTFNEEVSGAPITSYTMGDAQQGEKAGVQVVSFP